MAISQTNQDQILDMLKENTSWLPVQSIIWTDMTIDKCVNTTHLLHWYYLPSCIVRGREDGDQWIRAFGQNTRHQCHHPNDNGLTILPPREHWQKLHGNHFSCWMYVCYNLKLPDLLPISDHSIFFDHTSWSSGISPFCKWNLTTFSQIFEAYVTYYSCAYFLSARIISLVFSWLWKPPLPNSTFMVITVALCLHLMGTQSHPGGEKLGARQLPTRNSQASWFFIHPRDPRVLKPLYSMKFLETSGPNLRSQNFPIKQGPNGTCQAKILLRAQSLHLKQSCEPSMLHHNGCKHHFHLGYLSSSNAVGILLAVSKRNI